MADTRVKTLQLLYLLCWYSVLGISNYDVIFNVPRDGRKNTTAVVNPGSNVTFVCVIASGWRRLVTLYKVPRRFVARMYDEPFAGCQFDFVKYPRLHKKGCNDTSLSIVLSNVEASDTGEWYYVGNVSSQKIRLEVASTSDSSLAPIIPSTVPSTTLPSTLSQTATLQSTATTPSTGVEPEAGDDTSRLAPSDNMIPILGGAIGGGILFLVIITVVVVSLRRRKNSQSGSVTVKRTTQLQAVGVRHQGTTESESEDGDYEMPGNHYEDLGERTVEPSKTYEQLRIYQNL